MTLYVAKTGGWMAVVAAPNRREAWRTLRSLSYSASLRPSDIPESLVRPATPEEIDWHRSMGGVIPPVKGHDMPDIQNDLHLLCNAKGHVTRCQEALQALAPNHAGEASDAITQAIEALAPVNAAIDASIVDLSVLAYG